jgi:hypothetical protein
MNIYLTSRNGLIVAYKKIKNSNVEKLLIESKDSREVAAYCLGIASIDPLVEVEMEFKSKKEEEDFLTEIQQVPKNDSQTSLNHKFLLLVN